MIWAREVEGETYATPERRAALDARIGELAKLVRDEVVRKYYRQDLAERLRRFLAPEGRESGFGGRWGGEGWRSAGRGDEGFRRGGAGPGGRRYGAGGGYAARPMAQPAGGAYQPASAQLAASPLLRGQRSTLPRREALILQSLLNHPWILHDHLEEVAALELAHPEAHRLRAALIAAFAHGPQAETDPEAARTALREKLAGDGLHDIIQRVGKTITTGAVWGVQGDAAVDDVLMTWHQLVSLHRQWNSLTRELKDAEIALGQDSSDANYAWLQDVKERLAVVDGLEAQIEGFGEASGRPHGGM